MNGTKLGCVQHSPLPIFCGEKGREAYLKILSTPREKYDHVAEAEKAAAKLREQGFIVDGYK